MKKGSKHKKESIEKVKRNRKGKGKWTEERRRKMKLFLKGNTWGFQKGEHPGKEFKKGDKPWNDGLAGLGICKAWNKNIPTPEEVKEKIRLKLKGRIVPEETIEKMRKGQQKRWSDPVEKTRMMKILSKSWKKEDTIIEKLIEEELKKKKIFFIKQHLIGIYVVDFYIPEYNIVIEADGCYYHACHQCGFTKYHQEKIEKDVRKTEYLEKVGYDVYRFWGHEISKDPFSVLESIHKLKRKSDLYSDIENVAEMATSVS